MRKLAIIFFVFYTTYIVAQTECDNNVSTNYQSPTNESLPINLTEKFLNGTNWFPVGSVPGVDEGLYLDLPLTNMSFAGVTLDEMVSIRSSSLLEEYNYLKQGPLPIGINGWELLLINLGRFPDDSTPIINGNDHSALPYLVIYNRYSGVIRVFANFGLDQTVGNGADAVEVSISFIEPLETSGLMRLYEGHDQALDQNTDVIRMTSVAKASNSQKQWFSTDFQIAYDPCTCFYPSELQVRFRQIKNQSIELHGRSISLPDEAIVNSDLKVKPLQFLSGFDYTGESVEGGVLIYKSMQAMIDDYLEKYKKFNKDLVANGYHNAYVKKNMAILQVVKFVIAVIATNGSATTSISGDAISDISDSQSAGMSATELLEAFEGTGESDWFSVVKKYSDGVIKNNNEIDANKLFKAVKLIFGESGETFIANNFETKNPPTPPVAPTATFTEMHFTGNISEYLDKSGPTFYSPGTYGAVGTGSPVITNVYQYPVYNDVLGTFALLKSPKIRISKQFVTGSTVNQLFQDTYTSMSGIHNLRIMRALKWAQEYQFKLGEDLKYAVNSNLDVTNVEIKAAFSIKAYKKELEIPINTQMNLFIDKNIDVNLNSKNINLDLFSPIVSRHELDYYRENPDFNYQNYGFYSNPTGGGVPGFVPIAEPTTNRDTLQFATRFYPFDAFYTVPSSLGIINEAINLETTQIPEYDIQSYDTSFITYGGLNGYTGIYFDNLSDDRIIKPESAQPFINGYDLDFEVELKLIVDMTFATLNEYGNPNTTTQIYTYKIRPQDIIYENVDIIPDLVESNYNYNDIPENIHISEQNLTMNTSIPGCSFRIDGWPYLT